jgi:ribosomal protein S18 acetylase RimI-like enzyme
VSEKANPPADLPAGCRLTVEEAPAIADRKLIEDTLLAFNQPFLPGRSKRVGIFIRDGEGKILAGLDAVIRAGWMFVDNLWVDASLRGQGVGRQLMAQAEVEAVARGCHSTWLDTMSFQAPGFYRKLGYEIFATLDYPPEHQRHFLRKRLT